MIVPNTPRNVALIVAGSAAVMLVFFILALSIINHFSAPTTPAVIDAEDPDTTLAPEAELKLQEQIAPLIKAGDMAACDQVQNTMYRSVCINNIALNKASETKDISHCQYLDNELIPRETCERQVIFQKSMEMENIGACNEATSDSLREECTASFHVSLAQKKNDPAICDQSATPTDCRDRFVFSQLMTAPQSADCSLFATTEAQTDCEALHPLLTITPDLAKLASACQNIKTQLFSFICRQVAPNVPVLPR
jgi:hypothetical protein